MLLYEYSSMHVWPLDVYHLPYVYVLWLILSVLCISGDASITNGMAQVTVTGLVCGMEYTIVAGGTLNGDLVGPRRFIVRISTTNTCQRLRFDDDVGDSDVGGGGGGDDNEG